MFRHLRPLGAQLEVKLNNCHVFLGGPLALDHLRVQVVVPALTTLLTDSARERHRYLGPVLGTFLEHNTPEKLILRGRPRSAGDMTAIAQDQISLVAQNLGLSQRLRDAIPRVFTMSLHQFNQFLVLCQHRHAFRYLMRSELAEGLTSGRKIAES